MRGGRLMAGDGFPTQLSSRVLCAKGEPQSAPWPVAFHRHKAGGDALSCPPVPLKTYRLTNLKLRAMRQTAEGIRQTADGIRSENSREEAQEVTAGDGYELAFQPA